MKKLEKIRKWLKELLETKKGGRALRSTEELRKIEKVIAKGLLVVLVLVMFYPLIFWSGPKRWIGVLIDLGILYALYKAIFRDIPIVHIGMVVSPFWGRLKEYLPEGKRPVLPWDKIESEELKVKVKSVEEKGGYFTLDGAPIKLMADIFYRIDKNNIYLYKEVEGTEGDAMDGKVRGYLYGMIGGMETDEVVAHQGEIARGVLEEIRLHPITSKVKMLTFRERKLKLLRKELEIAEKEISDENDAKRKDEKKKKYEEQIIDLKKKIAKVEVDIETLKEEISNLYDKEVRYYQETLELNLENAREVEDQKRIEELNKELEEFNQMTSDKQRNKIKDEIEKKEEAILSELESQFAIRILASRVYGLDIADEDAKKGRSKRTTAMFERKAVLTEWGTTDMVMAMLKEKYPGLSDSELLEAVLVNRGRIEKKKKVFEIEGLKEVLPEIAKAIFGSKK